MRSFFVRDFLLTVLFFGTHILLAVAQPELVDKDAIPAAKTLYGNLFKALDKGIMFGHQDDLAYGVHWKYVPGNSDTKLVTGEYPGMYGWELGHIETDSPINLDSVPFDKMKEFVTQGHKRGSLISISWHLNNPLTGKSAWDPAPGTVAAILPGGSKHALYQIWLDKLADFLVSLKDEKGNLIPVIFRPYHEGNGSWFWWGKDHCTPDEFKQLWRSTVAYLRDTKNLHHLIYAFNTDRFGNREAFLQRYPGDEWVDVIGFDIYQRELSQEKYLAEMDRMFSVLTDIAFERKKVPALTEFGGNIHKDANWWTGTFLKALEKHKISYVLAWRNAGLKQDGSMEYYIPFPGEYSEADFIKFYKHPKMLFQHKTDRLKLYGKYLKQ